MQENMSTDNKEKEECLRAVIARLQAADKKPALAVTIFDEIDDSEEKASAPPVQSGSRAEAVDISSIPTREEQMRAHHLPKKQSWPTGRSRKRGHRKQRAPVRQGSTIYHYRPPPPPPGQQLSSDSE